MAHCLSNLAHALTNLRDLEAVVHHRDAASVLLPQWGIPYFRSGLNLELQGAFELAKYLRAQSLNPGNGTIRAAVTRLAALIEKRKESKGAT